MAGDPDLATTLELLRAAAAAGADLIELGVPFSDPMADGPVLQRSAERALAAGTTLTRCSSWSPSFRRGVGGADRALRLLQSVLPLRRRAARRATRPQRGADGFLCVDLPPEEADDLQNAADAAGLDLIFLLAPTSDAARIERVLARARGFVYFVSITGVTGAAAPQLDELAAMVRTVQARTALPVGVGFGIRTPEQAAQVARIADAVIVGSAIMSLAEECPGAAFVPAASDFLGQHGGRGAWRAAEAAWRALTPTSAAELWVRCPECAELVYRKKLERRLNVCPRCGYHFRLSADQRLLLLLDRGSFVEHDAGLGSCDVLGFPDDPPYEQRLAEVAARSGRREAVVTGTGRIDGVTVALAVFDFGFMGGSMGSAVGEKITRVIEHALGERLPLVIVSASGGARMQEGIFSLMQMAKLSAALGRLRAAGLAYVSLLTDPTTGGVAASVALLGDVNIAEPRALIGFAGPRVIAQTISEQLPEGFQRAEFLLEHGMLDAVVERHALRSTLARVLHLLVPGGRPESARPRRRSQTGPRARRRAKSP